MREVEEGEGEGDGREVQRGLEMETWRCRIWMEVVKESERRKNEAEKKGER